MSTGSRELRARRRFSTSNPQSFGRRDVENQQIEPARVERRIGLAAVLGPVDRIPRLAQRARNASASTGSSSAIRMRIGLLLS